MKHLRDVGDITRDEMEQIWQAAAHLKGRLSLGIRDCRLAGKTVALIFEKPSVRTRVSFEVGASQLGAHSIYLSSAEVGIGTRESPKDVARVLSRYVDALVLRVYRQQTVDDIAAASSVPVINGLSDEAHPCQALSDLFTVREKFGQRSIRRICYVGDANNVCRSLLWCCAKVGIEFVLAAPPGYEISDEFLAKVSRDVGHGKLKYELVRDPKAAARGADILYTDTWVSMGQEAEAQQRIAAFQGYQINDELLAVAPEAFVMHCLPAKRGYEITDSVVDGERSIVLDQAENRLHTQKAILLHLMEHK